MVEERGDNTVRWGTWEELILGGAVLRHGSHNWDAVASELQTRSLYPYFFTPKVCKAKYKVLQECYSDCSAWFEELRKKRVNELSRELEKSEESIGSLETKLETLKSEKAVCSYADQGCSAAESSEPLVKSGENESFGKEVSRDGSSAGSFTQETRENSLPQCQAAATETSVEKRERKPVVLEPSIRLEKFPANKKVTKGNVQPALSPDANVQNPCTSEQGMDEFVKILDSIMENEHASVFRRRLDSQKRARYKRIIGQHMDLDTIRSRIANKSITSIIELLRDLLLLANNALVFYSKCTREYNYALVFRDLVTKTLHQHYKVTGNKFGAAETPKTPMHKPPAKPRRDRPFNSKILNQPVMAVNNAQGTSTVVARKVSGQPPGIVGSPSSAESAALTKKIQGKRGKVGRVRRGNAGIQAETPMKVRKRARVK
uniref:Bromo domain-containing protein n=1 Tax=Chenopodium quinoa TaxID=63459 RepID=A0A803LPP9_CHEQI